MDRKRLTRAGATLGVSAAAALVLPLVTSHLVAAHAATALPWSPPPITVTAPNQVPVPASEFGADIVNFEYTGWGTKAEGLYPPVSLGVDRIWDDETTWAALEPARGQWDFSLLDQQVATATAKGSKVLYVMGETPTWASSDTSIQNIYGVGAAAPPASILDWQNYVAAVATRYKGKISSYEVWDEADAATFHGTPQQMVQLASVAYRTIKQIDPAATVVSPSFTQVGLTSGWISAYLAAGGGSVADAFVGHAYPNNPEQGGWYVLQYRKALASAGVNLPLWITETGYQGYSASGQALYTNAQAQAYVTRTLMDEVEGGASQVDWYGANTNGAWLSLGEGGYPGDAQAYTTMVKWLTGATPTGCGGYTSGAYAGLSGCYLRLANGSMALLAYDANGTMTMAAPSTLAVITSTLSGSTLLKPLAPITIGATPVLITRAA